MTSPTTALNTSALDTSQGPAPRTCLVVPASDPRKVEKSLSLDVDEVVLDLEDAVVAASKDSARAAVVEVLRAHPGQRLAVRVNQIGSAWCHRDIVDIVEATADVTIVVPKVESAADAGFVDRLVRGLAAGRPDGVHDVRVDLMIESAAALRDLHDIAAASPLTRALVIGYADLGADLALPSSDDTTRWDAVRHQVVVAARAAGIAAIDGPWLGITPDQPFLADKQRARVFGFDGTWVIHPGQVDAATATFSPTDDELTWAQSVVDTLTASVDAGSGAVSLDGQMLDEAVAVRARSALARAGQTR